MNQPCFSSLKELRKLGEIFFAKRFLFPCFWIDSSAGADQSNLHIFYEIIHWIKGFLHLKNPKFASCAVERERHSCSHPLWFFSPLVFWGVWLPRKSNFPIVFHGFSWEKNWLILRSFISQFLLVWIQEEAEIKLGVDSKCVSEEEGEKLKVEGTSQVVREWSVGLS